MSSRNSNSVFVTSCKFTKKIRTLDNWNSKFFGMSKLWIIKLDCSCVNYAVSSFNIFGIMTNKSFDINKGNRFATYAAKCIENELLMTFRSNRKRSRDVSLNEPVGTDKEGNEICLLDFLECQNGDVFYTVELNSDIKWLKNAIETCLTERERQVIALRYGFYGNAEKTQMEIANMLGISRSYVSRIEKKALSKLRAQRRE